MKLADLAGLAAAALLAGAASAQNNNYLNRMLHLEATWAGYVFGGSTANGGDALDTIADTELTDFGIDNVTAPGMQLVTGMKWVLQDSDALTSHQYGLVGYGEDPAVAGSPLVATPLYSIGPFASPTVAAGGGAAWVFTVTFTTPIQLPREQKNFIGLRLPAATSNTDLLLMQFIDNDITNANGPGSSLIYSQPGQSYAVNYPTPTTSHLLGIDAVTALPTFDANPSSMLIDLRVLGPGGHALTLSNEVANPAVTAPASVVTTPHTAFYPDAVDFNLATPPRADTVGYIYQDNAFVQSQDIVVFLIAFDLNALNSSAMNGPFPISNMLSGSTGNACIELTMNASLGLFLAPTSTGTGTPTPLYFERTVPLAASAVFQGLHFVIQGFTLSLASRTVRGGPCSIQTF